MCVSICKKLTEIIINVLEKFIDFLDFSIRLCVGHHYFPADLLA